MDVSRNADRLGVARSLVAAARSDRITFLAASLAYYAFVSVMPLLLLVVVVGSAVGGPAFADAVVTELGAALSPSGEQLLLDALTDASGRGGATVLGLAVLLWGALKLFRGLDVAFAEVYGTEGEASFLGQLRDAFVAFLAVGLGVGASVAASLAVGVVDVPLVGLFGPLSLAVGLTLTFLPLYVVLPHREVSVAGALPGALLAAVGWAVLSAGFAAYAGSAGSFQLYGVIGGVLLLVTWFYLGGIILLLGGVLNAVLSEESRSVPAERNRQLQQEPSRPPAQRMTDEPGGTPAASPQESGSTDGAETTEVAALRERLADLEADLDDRTVHREEIEGELKRYVRGRMRRGHAQGWGPYLVLLYGTAMTLGAFYLLSGGWAVLAMVIVWLSTLGLYALMLVVGMGLNAAGLPGRLRDLVGGLRR